MSQSIGPRNPLLVVSQWMTIPRSAFTEHFFYAKINIKGANSMKSKAIIFKGGVYDHFTWYFNTHISHGNDPDRR